MKARPTIIFLDENHFTSPVTEIITRLLPYLIRSGYTDYLAEMPDQESLEDIMDSTNIIIDDIDICLNALAASITEVRNQLPALNDMERMEKLTTIYLMIFKEIAKYVTGLFSNRPKSNYYLLRRFVKLTKCHVNSCLLHASRLKDPMLPDDTGELFDLVVEQYYTVLINYKSVLQSSLNMHDKCKAGAVNYVPIDHTESVNRILETLDNNEQGCAQMVAQVREKREAYMAAYHLQYTGKAGGLAFSSHGVAHTAGLQDLILKQMSRQEAERAFHFIFIQSLPANSFKLKANPKVMECRRMVANSPIEVSIVDCSDKSIEAVVQHIELAIETRAARLSQCLHNMPLAKFVGIKPGDTSRPTIENNAHDKNVVDL